MAPSRFEHPSAAPVTLLLPDLDCNAAGYWQRHWTESRIDCRAVDLGNARQPDRNSCVMRLDHALRRVDAPVILVGHGVGALTIAAWAGLMSSESENAVAGALLIGPCDPMAAGADPRLQCFAPLPTAIFTFPALVIASDDDPAISADRAFSLARQWGAGFARFGECGHFMPSDGLGWWDDGEELLDRFIDLVEPGRLQPIRSLDDLASPHRVSPSGSAPMFRP
ncbi:RBBP9/YdeN family alpha/beta hydrolase [Rhizorhabdus argentea]|uniref:RBBP9/YdeN family alpha/beta hydrolase n=1 Tax=Rhizorhabdus argentea TaxID=1387174 RepID=UPI0030EBBD73